MKIRDVDSSCFSKVGYDAEKEELLLFFRTGRVYLYYGIEQGMFEDFISAPSRGQYYNFHIKNFYECKEVTWSRE